MQTWKDYVVWTRETAQYQEAGTGSHLVLAYLTLGLIGEVAETLEIYSNSRGGPEQLLDELGDSFYYLARFDDEFGVGYPFVCNPPIQSSPSGIYAADKLAGKLANDAKKVLRQDGGSDCMSRVLDDVKHVGLSLRIFANSWLAVGQSFEDGILLRNHDKLMDRKSRGVIKGSGDER